MAPLTPTLRSMVTYKYNPSYPCSYPYPAIDEKKGFLIFYYFRVLTFFENRTEHYKKKKKKTLSIFVLELLFSKNISLESRENINIFFYRRINFILFYLYLKPEDISSH